MPADANRDFRLINACVISSTIQGQDVNTAAPYYGRIGLKRPPRTIVAGDHGINACFVGETEDGGVILAFRGTLSPGDPADGETICADWCQDRDYEDETWIVDRPSGTVARGFAQAWRSLMAADLTTVLNTAINANSRYLWITGHSKGGALSVLASSIIAVSYVPMIPVSVVTFGTPMAVKENFRTDWGNVDLERITTRYEFQYDVVPDVPGFPIKGRPDSDCPCLQQDFPAKSGFRPVGQELVFRTFNPNPAIRRYETARTPAEIAAAKQFAFETRARLSPFDAAALTGAAHDPKGDYFLMMAQDL